MSEEVEGDVVMRSPVSPEKCKEKKKRKHADKDDDKALMKKKRKHIHQELQVSPNSAAREQSRSKSRKEKKKDKKQERNDHSLRSPESSPTKTRHPMSAGAVRSNAQATQHTIASLSPPPSQSVAEPTQTVNPENESPSTIFRSTRASLVLPLPPVAISTTTAVSSLLAQHISPLLLTYHPPLKGIVISFSSPELSTTRPSNAQAAVPPLKEASHDDEDQEANHIRLAHSGDEHGVSYVWLTITFLLFCPQPGDELEGYINVASEGFVGVIAFNYFQISIGQERIPKSWKWMGPPDGTDGKRRKRKGKTAKLRDEDSSPRKDPMDSDEAEDVEFSTVPEDPISEAVGESGYFVISPSKTKISGPIRCRIVDTEMVPGTTADTWALSIQGTLLDPAEEEKVREAERELWERREQWRKEGGRKRGEPEPEQQLGARGRDSRRQDRDIVMSGALVWDSQTPQPSSTGKRKKHKK